MVEKLYGHTTFSPWVFYGQKSKQLKNLGPEPAIGILTTDFGDLLLYDL